MNQQKGLLTRLGEALDHYRAERRTRGRLGIFNFLELTRFAIQQWLMPLE
jgi:hypothetical protein